MPLAQPVGPERACSTKEHQIGAGNSGESGTAEVDGTSWGIHNNHLSVSETIHNRAHLISVRWSMKPKLIIPLRSQSYSFQDFFFRIEAQWNKMETL